MAVLFLALAILLLTPHATLAHANLAEADPPADGLAVTSPDVLTLSFTEEVVMDSPAPAITLLDQQGNVVGDNPLPLLDSGNTRQVVADVPDLDPGTYTVSWSVTSATDGHALSGAYAFRVGGGLPPGLATTEDDRPEAWAVVTRWLTFLGAAVVAGLLLFPVFFLRDGRKPPRWPRLRSVVILAGALVALLATLAEPLLQWLLDGRDASVSLWDVTTSMPDGWWWRPWTLIPLALLAAGLVASRRSSIPPAVGVAGAALALASLTGLVLTSHAAGRETWHALAVAVNFIHQVAVALWTGGLAALVVWGISRRSEPEAAGLRWPTISRTALTLFAIALVSGVINTSFVFEFLSDIRDEGLSLDVFEPLWTSNYGVVLLVKLALLIIPFGLAVYHREQVRKFAENAGAAMSSLGERLRGTLRGEVLAVALVVAGGSTLALSTPPQATSDSVLDEVTLVSATGDRPEDGSILFHLTLAPVQTGENTFSVRLTGWNGEPLPTEPEPRVTLDLTSLNHGTVNPGVALVPAPDGTFATQGLSLSLDGWWQIDVRVQRAGAQNAVATFYALLPDPNTQGFDAPPDPEPDPDAEAYFTRALAQMTAWERVRWTEDLGSGNAAFVRADFAVIEGPDAEPDAHELQVVYSASFATLSNGQPPRPPAFDTRHSITIGDEAWLQTGGGDWLSEPPTRFTPPSGWGETYAGAEGFQLGTTQEIDGRELQVVTFHLPEEPTRAEAWFTWWIDPASGDVVQVAMIARQHYMVWAYTDINGDVVIEPPPGA